MCMSYCLHRFAEFSDWIPPWSVLFNMAANIMSKQPGQAAHYFTKPDMHAWNHTSKIRTPIILHPYSLHCCRCFGANSMFEEERLINYLHVNIPTWRDMQPSPRNPAWAALNSNIHRLATSFHQQLILSQTKLHQQLSLTVWWTIPLPGWFFISLCGVLMSFVHQNHHNIII